MTKAEPPMAKPLANAPPCVTVCSITPSGNAIEPASIDSATSFCILAPSAAESNAAPSTIVGIAMDVALRLRQISRRPTGKCKGQRPSHAVQGLMLDKYRIVQPIKHAEEGQRHAAEYQDFARGAHGSSPSLESNSPVQRSTPASIPINATITSSPPTSANPPA